MTRIDPETALRDAGKYLRRRGMARGATSTLRKAMRGQRIRLGERPLRCRGEDELVTGSFVIGGRRYERVVRRTLHPTKGWKLADRFVRKA